MEMRLCIIMDGGNVELELAQYRGQLSLYLPEKKKQC